MVVKVVLTGWDGQIGGRLAPRRSVHLAIAWVLWISDVRGGVVIQILTLTLSGTLAEFLGQ